MLTWLTDKNFCAGSRLIITDWVEQKHRRQQHANVLITLDKPNSHTIHWKLKQTHCGAAVVVIFACDVLCRKSAASFSESSSNEMGPAASAALPAGSCPVLSVSCQEEREKATVRQGGGGAEWMREEEEGHTEKRRAGLSHCVPEK